MLDFEEDFELETINLYSLSNCLLSIIGDKTMHYGEEQRQDISRLYSTVGNALDMLAEYDSTEDKDDKCEIGYLYSEISSHIDDVLDDMSKNGINLYLH